MAATSDRSTHSRRSLLVSAAVTGAAGLALGRPSRTDAHEPPFRVYGHSHDMRRPGVYGDNTEPSGVGVYGIANAATNAPGAARTSTGVLGAAQSPEGVGVLGVNMTPGGIGVNAVSRASGTALFVEGPSEYTLDATFRATVRARSFIGTETRLDHLDADSLDRGTVPNDRLPISPQFSGAVTASSFRGPGANGVPSFPSVGSAVIPAGAFTVNVEVAGLTTKDCVLATLTTDPGEGVVIHHVQRSAGLLKIVLTGAAAADTEVCYFVLRHG